MEDIRDIDAPQGAYAWLRDDAPDWSLYVDQTLEMIGLMAGACRRFAPVAIDSFATSAGQLCFDAQRTHPTIW